MTTNGLLSSRQKEYTNTNTKYIYKKWLIFETFLGVVRVAPSLSSL